MQNVRRPTALPQTPNNFGTFSTAPARLRTHGGRIHTSSRSLLLSGTLPQKSTSLGLSATITRLVFLPHDSQLAEP